MVYRIITAHIARSLMKLNRTCPLVSMNQKGFIPGSNGCAEHSAKLNELLVIANNEHRSIYTAAIDFKDAFGSVPHKLITKNMKEIGLPDDLTDLVQDIYKNTSLTLEVRGQKSKEI